MYRCTDTGDAEQENAGQHHISQVENKKPIYWNWKCRATKCTGPGNWTVI